MDQNPSKSLPNIMYNVNENQWVICNSTAKWTKFEDKVFEEALVIYSEDIPDRWAKIASRLSGKTAEDVRIHYEALLSDVLDIESGWVDLPNYVDELFLLEPEPIEQISSGCSVNPNHGAQRKRKGISWTVEEHRLFLMGVNQFGWGDWRSISRNSVVTRTPAQVASHAQKYQLRQNAVKKERKRSSIHDITTSFDCKTVPAPTNSRNRGYQISTLPSSG